MVGKAPQHRLLPVALRQFWALLQPAIAAIIRTRSQPRELDDECDEERYGERPVKKMETSGCSVEVRVHDKPGPGPLLL